MEWLGDGVVRHRGGARRSSEVEKVLDLSKRGFHSNCRSVFYPNSVCLALPFLTEPLFSLLFSIFLNLLKEGHLFTSPGH